jgi:membrane protein required for colicin V production
MVTDILLLLVLVMAFYKGWTKGLIMALFVFISYFIALALAFQFSGMVQGYFWKGAAAQSKWYGFLAFAIVLIAGIILIRIIGKMVEKLAEAAMLGIPNRLLGIALFAFIYCSIYAVILVFIESMNSTGLATSTDGTAAYSSISMRYLLKLGNWVILNFSEWLPAMKNLFNQTQSILKQGA